MSYPQDQIIAAFEHLLAPRPPKDLGCKRISPKGMLDEAFEFISSDLGMFTDSLKAAAALRITTPTSDPPHFVDVGCGIGTKLVAAHSILRYSYQITGIEYFKPYAKVAKALTENQPDTHIIIGNALQQSYEAYDIIYFYCPMSDRAKEVKLECRIIATAKPGALFIPFRPSYDWQGDPRVALVYKNRTVEIWGKKC